MVEFTFLLYSCIIQSLNFASLMKKLLLILSLIFLNSCRTTMSPSEFYSPTIEDTTPIQTVSYDRYSLYEVASNDTLASVARKYNLLPAQIIKMNNLESPYSLQAGTIIKIPMPLNTTSNPALSTNENASKKGIIYIKPKALKAK